MVTKNNQTLSQKQPIYPLKTLIILVFFSQLLFASDFSYTGPTLINNYAGPITVHNSQFKYPSSEKLNFSTQVYLKNKAPELLPLRDTIDAWAAMKSIHPKVLTALLQAYFKGVKPESNWENKNVVFQIAAGLNEGFTVNKQSPMAASAAIDAISNAFGIVPSFGTEFSQPRDSSATAFNGSTSLFGYLQPPWPRGEYWGGGGVHLNGGSGTVRNALDFWGGFESWGGDTANYWVSAAQAGIARVWSSCSMTVIHANGWETSYYHLDNIQVSDQAAVIDNEALSNYADNEAQALCNGGGSTGPHIHMGVWDNNGDAVLIDEPNMDFTSWTHHAGEGNYDFDCDTSYYTLLPSNNIICPGYLSLPNTTTAWIDLIFMHGFD